MAGGPNAAIMACRYCVGPADRVYEGIEDDLYQCRDCGKRFGIDWRRGGPERPCWPLSAEEERLARQLVALMQGKESRQPPA